MPVSGTAIWARYGHEFERCPPAIHPKCGEKPSTGRRKAAGVNLFAKLDLFYWYTNTPSKAGANRRPVASGRRLLADVLGGMLTAARCTPDHMVAELLRFTLQLPATSRNVGEFVSALLLALADGGHETTPAATDTLLRLLWTFARATIDACVAGRPPHSARHLAYILDSAAAAGGSATVRHLGTDVPLVEAPMWCG